MKRKMKASSNFVFPTMLQSVTRLSFSVFEESKMKKIKIKNWKLKIENWNQVSISVFGQRRAHSKWQKYPRGSWERERSSYSPVPSGLMSAIMNAGKALRKSFQQGSGKFNSLEQSLPLMTMHEVSVVYVKDLVVTQQKTHSEVSLLLKEAYPDRRGLSSRSVRRFCCCV